MSRKWMDLLREIAPGSGVFINEADLLEPNLQELFYGTNYPVVRIEATL